ncbi:hypothetical protein ACM64Y_07605 [Novispirillum sp. DQ9]|uniref:hypothetical protein n=1 Tax=Novispirillum sp. DQ9 TaxID=3398612 RepID=UPI003C7D8F04
MSNPKTRSRQDNIREMQRLQAMYERLPADKKKAARGHMQARLNELSDAINGKPAKAKSKGFGVLETVLVVVIACVVAVAAGFFGVTYFAKGG